MKRLEISKDIQFFINKITRTKNIIYQSFRYDEKHKSYESYNKNEKLKLGFQFCDFVNTDFNSFDSFKAFIDKYSIVSFAELSNIAIYRDYNENEYLEMIKNVLDQSANKIEKYKKAFIEDIKYIYNLNDLEELRELSPSQRLHILRGSKQSSAVLKMCKSEDLKIKFNNFGDFTNFSITNEESAQEIAKYVDNNKLSPYCFSCNNIIQSFIVELFEIATTENIEIKRCKNCGKYFVPDSRSNEIYCNNIYENNKTCKEVGHFRTQQRLMKEDDDLRIYRNVYQKLLLRTRRNLDNEQYEKEFQQFKEKNIELKEKVNNGKITQEDYMEWLNKQ